MRSALLILLIGASLPAQVSTGTITGTVSDSSGAVVPNASIRIMNEGTNLAWHFTTNAPGIYVATPLPPGTYRVEATVPGFQPQAKVGLVLSVDQTITLNFTLAPGEQKQNVQVVARSEQLVETATSSLGEVIEQQQVRDLPLNGRDFTDLIALNAGAQPSGGFYHINGGRGDSNGYLVEGIDVSSPSASMPTTLPSVESLGEFKIITNSFSAEYGRSLGGVITAKINSGTNKFRGTLFEYLRNQTLDAKGYFAPFKPKYIFNQYGGSIGGPIIRNRFFFFGDFQGARVRQGDPRQINIPTLAQRRGDFSAITARVFDPLTTPRVQFPGNIIPASRLDKAAVRMFSFLPTPNQAGPINFVAVPRVIRDTDIFNVRLDYNINERNRLSGHWTRSNLHSDAGAILGYLNGSALTNVGDGHPNTFSINYTRTISPRAVNELIVGLNRDRRVGPAVDGMQYDPDLGVPFLNTSPSDIRTTGYPSLSIPAYTAFGGPAGGPYRIIHTVPQLAETFTYIQGRHLLKTGVSYKLRPYNIDQSIWSRGRLVFNASTTGSGATGGDAAASALLGYPLTATRDASYPWGQRSKEAAVFLQDDWKATTRLTLNLGVRWEYFSPVSEQYNRLSNYNPATNSMLVAAQNGGSSSLVDPNWLNFGPRFGFAYQLTRDSKTVLRGGYGVSFVPLSSQGSGTQIRLTMNPPFRLIYSQTFTATNPVVRISDGLPLPTPATKNPTGDVYYIPSAQNPPYMQQWNLDVQRALPWDFLLDVAYAGSRGVHLTANVNINQAPPGPTAPATRSLISSSVNQIISLMNRETSTYHALQAKLTRRFARGFYLLGAYTFSKSIDDGSYTTSDGGGPQDARNWRGDRGISDFDRRHRLVVSYIYQLPFGKGRTFSLGHNRVVEHILGGWQLNGITTLQSGSPFTPVVANPRTNAGQGGAVRPDRIASGILSGDERTLRRWYDKTAFVAQGTGGADPYHFGNSGRNILVGPGLVNFDASIFKAFALTERMRLQFRTEMFNAMNTPHFNNPNANIDTAQAGIISAAGPARLIQFALKLSF